ncbi:MAG TPA: transporter substrate-binding domain-containing protein [Xanthobacteraceae bacterium]|jgi:polar amino acid transport system substrate-binding protein
MNMVQVFAVVLATTLGAGSAAAVEQKVLDELAPTGKLRVGVAYAPSVTPLFVAKDAAGQPHGVSLDLGTALAKVLGVPADVLVAATTGELTEAVAAGKIDIGFMPADDERRQRLDFSPPYFIIESTYLVVPGSDIKTIADVDRSDVTIVGVAGSTTIRAAGRTAKNAKLVAAKTVGEAMDALKSRSAQAFALTHDALPPLQKTLPGSRILDGAFQTTGVGVALQKNHSAALAFVTRFIEAAKADGTVRRALDDAGLKDLSVAPPEPQK